MTEHLLVALLAILLLVREAAGYIERQEAALRVDRLTERLTGVTLTPPAPRSESRAPVTDEEEWALEQERIGQGHV